MIDRVKLNHWLNIRKTSINVLNEKLKRQVNFKISLDNLDGVSENTSKLIAKTLDIDLEEILLTDEVPNYIIQTKEQINKTKRPIHRGGIHYYNYYTLPSPKGYVAPVLIDILCPKDKPPVLNNGHLEPAITVSLGPNDIYARFAKKINKTNFLKFKINPDPKTNWVVGSNYYEPSYCLHTYSRATNGPGKILSYTTKSNLEKLFGDKLNDNAFKNFSKKLDIIKPNRSMLLQDIENKGYSINELSKKTKISKEKFKNFFNNKKNFTNKELSKVCSIINSDPNLYLDRVFKEDKIGKHYYDYKDSLKTIRNFKSYKVASIASSARSQDLSGYFIKVYNKAKLNICDLQDSNCSHYLVTKGNINFNSEVNNKVETKSIKEGCSIWISSYLKHGFSGDGALIKISDGQNFNYLEKLDIINTYNLKKTLSRGRKDKINWGYDKN